MSYEAWRVSYQASEQAARAAWEECERLRKDAERYRWLLCNAGYGITKHQHGELYLGDRLIPAPDHIGQLSAAIDAAINDA